MWMIFFFFNDTATTEIYTLSLHDALPICAARDVDSIRTALHNGVLNYLVKPFDRRTFEARLRDRSEEHTSELQSRQYLVCRLLLEKKKKKRISIRLPPHHISFIHTLITRL